MPNIKEFYMGIDGECTFEYDNDQIKKLKLSEVSSSDPVFAPGPECAIYSEGLSALPNAMVTGQAIKYFGSPAVIRSGGVSLMNSGGAAGERVYVESDVDGPVTRMGAEFEFTGTTNDQFVVLVPWAYHRETLPLTTPPTGCHFILQMDSLTITTFDVNLTNETNVGVYRFDDRLVTGVRYRVEWSRVGDTLYVFMPDGKMWSVSNPTISARMGNVPCWEILRQGAASNANAVIYKMWASSKDQWLAGPKRMFDHAVALKPSYAKLAVTPGSINIQSANTALDDTFFIAPKRGPEGKMLIELYGRVKNVPASTSIVCVLEFQNAVGTAVFSPSYIPVESAGDSLLQVRDVIDMTAIINAVKVVPKFRYVGTAGAIFIIENSFKPWMLITTPV